MKAETADYLAKANAAITDGRQITTLPLPHMTAVRVGRDAIKCTTPTRNY
jgi:hypothetical protein